MDPLRAARGYHGLTLWCRGPNRYIRSRSRSGISVGRSGRDRCCISVALPTSTRSVPGQGCPARCWPESSPASSASSRTGRSASSSCLPNRYGYAIPAMAAPMSGASQNTHSWADAPLALKNATPVERAGLTDVLDTGIETRWIRVRVRPMARPANPLGARSSVDPRMTSRKTQSGRSRRGSPPIASSHPGSARQIRWRPCCPSR